MDPVPRGRPSLNAAIIMLCSVDKRALGRPAIARH
ncbi:MAG: hypothetical protein EXQ86_01850 [Rhodospirillales bacterium]|nr:hypothetical protein [Rhodospirillales bacterium]